MMMTSNSSGVPNDESLMGGGDMNPGGANPLSGDFIVNQSPGRPSNSSFSGSNAGSSPAYMQSPIHNNPPSSSAHNVQFNPMDQCPNFAFNSEPGKTWFASKEMLHNLVVVQSLSVLSFDNCSIFMVTYALIMIIVFGNLLVYKDKIEMVGLITWHDSVLDSFNQRLGACSICLWLDTVRHILISTCLYVLLLIPLICFKMQIFIAFQYMQSDT